MSVLVLLVGISLLNARVQFRTSVEAVRVSAIVTHRGRPVTGLTARDFEVRDNGVAQTVQLVDPANVALDVILVLDSSQSIARSGMERTLKAAAHAALAQLRPVDRASLVHFSHHVSVVSPFTSDVADLESRMYLSPPAGATAMFDALLAALMTAAPQPGRRTLLVLYTDGFDTISWHPGSDVLEAADRSDVAVYAVAPEPDRRTILGRTPWRDEHKAMWGFLGDLAERTGGARVPADTERLPDTFREIVRRFAQGYELMFYPKGVGTAGWHNLTVRLRNRSGEVQARRGYQGR